MKFTIAICDDEKPAAERLREMTEKWMEQKRLEAQVICYQNGQDLLYDLQEGQQFDLLLSDIEMPGCSGMELAERVREFFPEILIVFVTDHLQYAIDAFALSVFRYIPKEELQLRLAPALEAAVRQLTLQADQYYVIETHSRSEKLPCRRILYLSRQGKYVEFVLQDGEKTTVRKSISAVWEELPQDQFLFIDRGTIVNLVHVRSLKKDMMELSEGIRLPVSLTRLNEIRGAIHRFWRKQG